MRTLRHKKAFSLIEVVMAMGAFTIIMMGIVQIMAQSSKSYRGIKVIQTNLENAQFALNTMAKELRTSSVVFSSTGATSSQIIFFDYSQNRCIDYRVNESTGILSKRTHSFTDTDPNNNRTNCQNYSFTESYETLATNLTNQAFSVRLSRNMPSPDVGIVTVALTVGTGGAQATIQTTVSLRDFNYVGI